MLSLRVGFLIYTMLSIVLVGVSAQSLFKIINSQYRGQAMDDGQAKKLMGFHIKPDSNNQIWDIQSVGRNKITIKNVASGLYIGVKGDCDCEVSEPEVISGETPYKWHSVLLDGGWSQIATTDGGEVLFLTGGNDYDPVVLKTASYKGQDSLWNFKPTSRVP
ncbi:hypothetical protein EMPS_06546 [Entomortierella parvispora]|uniref:Ricin B lectin domain-containing protein n=1 Tax=Entomortierella parvispora TaxID=205924 RepID=A0A9P3HCX5_9FUNG|nr:hypothetical protein EMPS_06546 [Entomortierella parvispora]